MKRNAHQNEPYSFLLGEDLRYLFGEIMYGGHITDDWDRRLCKTYLEEYMNPQMVRHEERILLIAIDWIF